MKLAKSDKAPEPEMSGAPKRPQRKSAVRPSARGGNQRCAQGPVAEMSGAPMRPVAEMSGAPMRPVAGMSGAPMRPVAEMSGAPMRPWRESAVRPCAPWRKSAKARPRD